MKCSKCGGIEGVRDVSGKEARLDYFKAAFNGAHISARKKLADRIMDVYQEELVFLCVDCLVCGACFMKSGYLAPCDICGLPACENCSLPALKLQGDGSLKLEKEGAVLCVKCNPPHGGRNVGIGYPDPTPEHGIRPTQGGGLYQQMIGRAKRGPRLVEVA